MDAQVTIGLRLNPSQGGPPIKPDKPHPQGLGVGSVTRGGCDKTRDWIPACGAALLVCGTGLALVASVFWRRLHVRPHEKVAHILGCRLVEKQQLPSGECVIRDTP